MCNGANILFVMGVTHLLSDRLQLCMAHAVRDGSINDYRLIRDRARYKILKLNERVREIISRYSGDEMLFWLNRDHILPEEGLYPPESNKSCLEKLSQDFHRVCDEVIEIIRAADVGESLYPLRDALVAELPDVFNKDFLPYLFAESENISEPTNMFQWDLLAEGWQL